MKTDYKALIIIAGVAFLMIILLLITNLEPFPAYDSSLKITARREQPRNDDPYSKLILVHTKTIYAHISAYNTVSEQTNGNPCISANGTNICEGMNSGYKYVAANFLDFGTYVKINKTIYQVVDRVGKEYTNRIDIAYPADQVEEAIQWGVRMMRVEVYENNDSQQDNN